MRAEFAAADAQRANRIEGCATRRTCAASVLRGRPGEPAGGGGTGNRIGTTVCEIWRRRATNAEVRTAARDTELSERQVARIHELTRDFEQVWNAPETDNTDRKRLLGLLIEDAALTRNGYAVRIDLRMRGGKTLTLDTLTLPRPIAQLRKTPPETLGRARPTTQDPYR